jgi:hypothetical protein
MTNEEASARKGLGVQSVDETLKGTLTSTHGDYALIKLGNGSIVWLECSKLKEWDAPAPEPVVAESTEPAPNPPHVVEQAEPAPLPEAGTVTEMPAAAQTGAENTMPSEGTRVPIPQEVEASKPAANPFVDRALNKEEAIVSAKTLVPSIEWDQDNNSGLAYAVGQFGWTVLYQGRLRRVIMVFSDGTIGIDVDGRNLILPMDSPELS